MICTRPHQRRGRYLHFWKVSWNIWNWNNWTIDPIERLSHKQYPHILISNQIAQTASHILQLHLIWPSVFFWVGSILPWVQKARFKTHFAQLAQHQGGGKFWAQCSNCDKRCHNLLCSLDVTHFKGAVPLRPRFLVGSMNVYQPHSTGIIRS